MDEFFDVYEAYRNKYNLRCRIYTSKFGDNRLRIWQELSISENRTIVDVTAEDSIEMYQTAANQLRSFFTIFKKGHQK